MKTLLCIIVFLLIGAAAGTLMHRKYDDSSLLLNVLLGVVGSLGISWLVSLLGLGAGFTAFSLWGIVFGILGAALIPLIYCLIQNRSRKKTTAKMA